MKALQDEYGNLVEIGHLIHWISKKTKISSSHADAMCYPIEVSKHSDMEIFKGGAWWIFINEDDMKDFIANDYNVVILEF